jgi:hypothetical protein
VEGVLILRNSSLKLKAVADNALGGTLPEDISLAKLYKLPDRREEQLKQLGIAVE